MQPMLTDESRQDHDKVHNEKYFEESRMSFWDEFKKLETAWKSFVENNNAPEWGHLTRDYGDLLQRYEKALAEIERLRLVEEFTIKVEIPPMDDDGMCDFHCPLLKFVTSVPLVNV